MLVWMTMAAAKCASGWVSVSDAPLTVDAPRLIVEFSGTERDRLDGFRPELVRGPDRVELRIAERIDGRNGVTQIVFEPTEALAVGTWALHARGERFERQPEVAVANARPKIAWPDGRFPVQTSTERFGCGPAVHAHVDLGVKNTWVDVALQGPNGSERAWVHTDDKGGLTFGHGMCGGLFAMEPGQYTATLGHPGDADLTVEFTL